MNNVTTLVNMASTGAKAKNVGAEFTLPDVVSTWNTYPVGDRRHAGQEFSKEVEIGSLKGIVSYVGVTEQNMHIYKRV